MPDDQKKPEHFETAYSDAEKQQHDFDPTKDLGDAKAHPEHFKTAYSDPEAESSPDLDESKLKDRELP